ncbi:MAG: hypothetical protein M3Y79_00120 [Pseudomonadota bacterium]|nr:hypothetical protein [Pseudomonadota bacterium]
METPSATSRPRVAAITAFVPARDFARSRSFYLDLGFEQPWGLRVLYLTDPNGVLWHIAETPGK